MKVFILILFFFKQFQFSYISKKVENCCIKSKNQAIELAGKEFVRAYGHDILLMKPYIAKLINNKVWIVKGTKPNYILGRIPYIEIQKKDCKILKMYHTK